MEKTYHYRTRRRNGKVVRKYIGRMSQPAVQFLARAQRLTEAERQQAAEKRKHQKLQAQRIAASMKHLTDTCRFWSGLDLCYAISSRRAQQSQTRALAGHGRPLRPRSELKANMVTQAALKKLLKAAQSGDEVALAELRKVRRNAPQVLACIVDIVQVARAQLLDAMAEDSPANRELVSATVDEKIFNLSEEYGHDPLGKLYVEIAAVAHMDALHGAVESANPCHTLAARERRSALADRAFKRFCIAVQFLEQRRPPETPSPETLPTKRRNPTTKRS